MAHLPVLFGDHLDHRGNNHVALSLCRWWNESGKRSELTAPSADDHIAPDWVRPVMGRIKRKWVYRFASTAKPRHMAEQYFLKKERHSPVVYLWAGLSTEIFQAFHDVGASIVIERINCHRRTGKRVIQAASAAWGIPTDDPFDPRAVEGEDHKLSLASSIFCPSPMVRRSLIESGVPEGKLMSTSYGWAPERFLQRDAPRERQPGHRPKFLFVGSICVRKGVPLLLKAWERADLNAELVLCGRVAPEIEKHMPPLNTFKNVRHLAFTDRIGEVYNDADVFVFPTLEEGGPMVTYEAMAHGVPPLVTAMGAGAVVEDGVSGVVLPDLDVDAWAQAMTQFAHDVGRRESLGREAKRRAQDFTWQAVAAQRAALLQPRHPTLWNGPSSHGRD